jgi:hypothetical protein
MPKYPEVEVKLVGEDGNAFSLMGIVSRGLKNAGLGAEVEAFREEAMSGDYDHLLATCLEWVTVS